MPTPEAAGAQSITTQAVDQTWKIVDVSMPTQSVAHTMSTQEVAKRIQYTTQFGACNSGYESIPTQEVSKNVHSTTHFDAFKSIITPAVIWGLTPYLQQTLASSKNNRFNRSTG